MSRSTLLLTLRQRALSTAAAGLGLVAVMVAVGALFPAVGHTIGQLNVPQSVTNMLGGADYGTVTGWFRSEVGSIYGPLVVAAIAITGVAAVIAGEEEDRILALILAYPLRRSALVLSKAVAIALSVALIAFATWVGLIVGVLAAGGGISVANMAALAIQLALYGLASGAVAVALAGATGRRSFSTGVAAAVAIVGWLINSFAPLVSSLSWLRYLSLFYYYDEHDPLANGVGVGGLVVLAAVAVILTATGMVLIERRDLRG